MATSWAVALAVPAALAVTYLAAWARLLRRGVRWPPGRPAAALLGLGCAGAAVAPPVTAAAHDFPVHVGQHLVLAMLAPLLLALAAPVTLALRTLPRAPRALLLLALHSRWTRLVTRPAVVVLLQVVPLYLLYLTPLVHVLHAGPAAHLLVHGHMVAAGCLLSWLLAGADPVPHRPGVAVRLTVLVVVAGAHDVLARLLYARAADLAALGTPGDVRLGALVMSYGATVVDLLLAVAVMAGWYAAGGRRLRHEQRRAAVHRPAGDAAGRAVGGLVAGVRPILSAGGRP